ncbi:hypothetical protein WKW80_33615 [Variovorax humicola]|uniref:Transposase n=1 Tax=Variovorax humicola TaxID=1769758 RepID=A0ABU8WA12_9BURK
MDSTELYRQLLGVTTPWTVQRVDMDVAHLRVDVHLATILRWMQRFVPEFEKRWNRFAGKAGRSHRLKASPPYLAAPDTHRSTGLRSNASGTSVPASGRHE